MNALTRLRTIPALFLSLLASAPLQAQIFGMVPTTPAPSFSGLEASPSPEVLMASAQTSLRSLEIGPGEANVLATLAILEAGMGCSEERLDIAQVIFNRINLGEWGRSITSVAFARGQFEAFFRLRPNQVDTEAEGAAAIARLRGVSQSRALAALRAFKRDLGDPAKMRNARRFVGGRVFFKGTSQLRYRVASEDPMRGPGCNFFHIGSGQTYSQLQKLEQRGPERVEIR